MAILLADFAQASTSFNPSHALQSGLHTGHMPDISRRDFLNGVALTVAAGLTPAAQIAAEPLRYPPALTGLRGQHAGSFETAHAQAREGKRFPLDRLPVEERYDLVVVGAGISGLAAAAFYRRAVGPSA